MGEIGLSISGSFIDQLLEGDPDVVAIATAARYNADFIEYHNDSGDPTEVSSTINSDIEELRTQQLDPKTIHLSNKRTLGTSEGYIDLNTGVKNSQLMLIENSELEQEKTGSRYAFWNPNTFVVHPPRLKESTEEKRRERTRGLVKDLTRVNQNIRENDQLSGVVGIENLPQNGSNYLVESPDDVVRLEEIAEEMGVKDDLYYVFDVGHTGKDNPWKKFVEVLPSNRTEEFHVHDWEYEDGSYDAHIVPGTGDLDVGRFLKETNNWDVDYVVELKPSEIDPESIEESADYIRDRV